MNYYMPTKIIQGKDCIKNNAHILKEYGTRALIVCGKNSAYKCGVYQDTVCALNKYEISYLTFDKVESNPSTDNIYQGAKFAKENNIDFIIAIGGGSPLDAGKAIALLCRQEKNIDTLFDGKYSNDVLPIIAIPTTAGTGSEVTPYAIITNHDKETKMSISSPGIYPRVAFLDGKYLEHLPHQVMVNTVFDSLSHAIEGMYSIRANALSNLLALEAISIISSELTNLKNKSLNSVSYEKLLYASTLSGIVISQTGTTIVHALGYNLTYYKGLDHGLANALLLPAFLELSLETNCDITNRILNALHLTSIKEYHNLTSEFFDKNIILTKNEIDLYTRKAMLTANIKNNIFKVDIEILKKLYIQK